MITFVKFLIFSTIGSVIRYFTTVTAFLYKSICIISSIKIKRINASDSNIQMDSQLIQRENEIGIKRSESPLKRHKIIMVTGRGNTVWVI